MSLLSPLWLIVLAPWLGLVFWLMWGRRRKVGVPFLELWRGPVRGPRARRSVQPPPVAVALALLGLLLAVLAAARPALSGMTTAGRRIQILVDRGFSMSARGRQQPGFRELARDLDAELIRNFGTATPVQVRFIPGGESSDLVAGKWIEQVDQAAPTASDTRQMVLSAIAGQLVSSHDPILVISDQLLPPDGRIIQIAPDRACEDAGIVHIAAAERPSAQVMVGVRNQSQQSSTVLVVASGTERLQKTIQLPPRGQVRNYFFDLPRLDAIVSAELRLRDDLDADKRACLVREGSSPRLEPRSAVPPELRRMIAAYHAARPPSDGSIPVAVVTRQQDLPANAPAILLESGTEMIAATQPQIVNHPITHHVRWDRLPEQIRVPSQAPIGWQPIVSFDGHTIVAVHADGPRQVWVGFDALTWAATPDFVVFWTNVFDWTGGGGERFAAHDLREWAAQWNATQPMTGEVGFWPGLYQRSDGTIRAFDAPDVSIPPPPHVDWRAKLAGLAHREGNREITAPLILAALASLAAAASLWKRAAPAPAPLPESRTKAEPARR